MKTISLTAIVTLVGLTGSFFTSRTFAQVPGTTDSLFVVPDGVETRWSSAENWKGEKGAGGQQNDGRKGGAAFRLKAGGRQVLAEVTGRSGMVRRIWVTIPDRSTEMLRGVKIEMFWDGAEKPAVAVPLGDFFCQGLGRMSTFQNALFASPEGRSFNCYIPMPFKTGMKIVATNEASKDVTMFFYDVDYTIGDKHPENVCYFHACFRRENPTKLREDYEILPKVTGRGRYLGTNIGVIADTDKNLRSWWGEGEVKIYLDGDTTLPTLCGTGTEDYIGTGWGMGQYANLYQGCQLADAEHYLYGFYRLHVLDPVYFHKDIRVTMQQIGYLGKPVSAAFKEKNPHLPLADKGHPTVDWSKTDDNFSALFERADDWSSCAYFYLDRPTNDLPALAPVAQRTSKLDPAPAPKR